MCRPPARKGREACQQGAVQSSGGTCSTAHLGRIQSMIWLRMHCRVGRPGMAFRRTDKTCGRQCVALKPQPQLLFEQPAAALRCPCQVLSLPHLVAEVSVVGPGGIGGVAHAPAGQANHIVPCHRAILVAHRQDERRAWRRGTERVRRQGSDGEGRRGGWGGGERTACTQTYVLPSQGAAGGPQPTVLAGSKAAVHPFLPSFVPGLTLVLGAGPLQHCTSACTEAIGPGCIGLVLLSRAGLHGTLSVAA